MNSFTRRNSRLYFPSNVMTFLLVIYKYLNFEIDMTMSQKLNLSILGIFSIVIKKKSFYFILKFSTKISFFMGGH